MGGMSAETATGGPASRGSYPLLPMDELDMLAAELQRRSLARPAERRLMHTMPGEQIRHFAEVPWVARVPRFGAAEPVPASRRLAREVGGHLSELASGVADNLAEWRRQQDIAEYQALPGWQQPLVATTDMADIFVDGVTLGFGNKVAAALGTLTSDDSYDELLAKNRATTQGAYNRAGLAGTALGLVGGVRSGKGLVDAGLGLSRWAPKAAQGAPKPDLLTRLGNFGKTSALAAADGAVVGALDAIGHDTDLGTGVATGAGIGVVMPGAFKAVGAALSPLVDMVSSSPAVQRMVADLTAIGQANRGAQRRASEPPPANAPFSPSTQRDRMARGIDEGSYGASDLREEYHDIPDMPQRPFEADYPRGAVAYETGRLREDRKGRPINSRIIAGRRFAGGPDVPLSREEVRAVGEGLGARYYMVDRSAISGDSGLVHYKYDDNNEIVGANIYIAKDIHPEDIRRSEVHETVHYINKIAGDIPADGLEGEVVPIYSISQIGQSLYPLRPQSVGYSGSAVGRELMAEAGRVYLENPNALKTMAPRTADRFADFINLNPRLNKVITVNSLPIGAIPAGIGAGLALGGEERREPKL